MLEFVVIASPCFFARTKVCLDSIAKFHPDALVHFESYADPLPGASYIDGFARRRIEKLVELLKEDKTRKLVLLGADCVLYNDLNILNDYIKQADIALCPHVLNPPDKSRAGQLYQTGYINGDLFVVCHRSIPMLEWILTQDLTENPNNSVFFEQIPLSTLPYFYRTAIINLPNINFAYYNFHERILEYTKDDGYVISPGYPLRMVQYSGYQIGSPERISKYYSGPDATGDLLKLFQEYDDAVMENLILQNQASFG